MDANKIIEFNKIIRTNNQIDYENSELWHCIKKVWNVSDKKAQKLGREYCNLISFYAVLKASGNIDDSLYQFMTYCKNTKWAKDTRKFLLDKDGFLRGKSQICNHYGFKLNKIYCETYNCVEDASGLDDRYFYQMKTNQRFKGFHFMGCYIENGTLYTSDSWNRGIAFKTKDKIFKRYKTGRKYFDWLLLIG